MSLAQIDTNIERFEQLERGAATNINDLNLRRKCQLRHGLAINGEPVKWLVKPNTDLRFIAIENLFRTLHEEHLLIKHSCRDIMHNKLKIKYANITVDLIKAYLKTCLICGLKKSRIRKGIVVKPVKSSDAWSIWQMDLIDMQSQPDGDFNFLRCPVQTEDINIQDIEYTDIFKDIHTQLHATKKYMMILNNRLKKLEIVVILTLS